jgi:rhamnulokinase
MAPRVFAAVDIGASGGRVMAGLVDGESVRLEETHRFPNASVERDGHLRWDISSLYEDVLTGIAKVAADHPDVESIGIDTWAVDYGLLDERGKLIAQPIAYRDDRTATVIDDVHAVVPPDELFATNGLQFLPFNTIYQLAAEKLGPHWTDAARVVLLPDLIAYWLTDELRTEYTNASTTGLLDVSTGDWSPALLDALDIPRVMLPPIESPGSVRGTFEGRAVTTVGSHDTASAVVGVPATTDRFAYIASGTWSLVGLELDHPVLSSDARAANFTNEGGVDGRTRFLRNVGGLWLLQESMRAWGLTDVEPLLTEAASVRAGGPTLDVDDPVFLPPGDMPARIVATAGLGEDATPAQIVRCVIDSLADAFARTTHEAAALAGRQVEVVHIVGGGSRNDLLCRLTADAAGLPVVAGPVEATAIGNVLVQARAHGAAPESLDALRKLTARSTHLRRFEPA